MDGRSGREKMIRIEKWCGICFLLDLVTVFLPERKIDKVTTSLALE
jgi:hypothetical protein